MAWNHDSQSRCSLLGHLIYQTPGRSQCPRGTCHNSHGSVFVHPKTLYPSDMTSTTPRTNTMNRHPVISTPTKSGPTFSSKYPICNKTTRENHCTANVMYASDKKGMCSQSTPNRIRACPRKTLCSTGLHCSGR